MKKATCKNLIIAVSIIVGIVLIGTLCIFVYFNFINITPKIKLDVSGTQVDNSYNNYLVGGKLCRAGDSLYLCYYKANNNHGTLQINKSGCRKISWRGPFSTQMDTYLDKVFEKNQYVYIPAYNKNLLYDEKRSKFIAESSYVSLSGFFNSQHYFTLLNDTLTEVSGEQKNIISENVQSIYETKDTIYYMTDQSLKKYEMASGKTNTVITHMPSYSKYIVNDSFVAYLAEKNLYAYSLADHKPIGDLYDHPIRGFNVYNNKVYACTDKSIVMINPATREKKVIISYPENLLPKPFDASITPYIVDDTWIYFSIDQSSWYRVRQDGTGEVETILE